jgi:hypothetical protein
VTCTDVAIPNELESTSTESIDEGFTAETTSKGTAPVRRAIVIKLAD